MSHYFPYTNIEFRRDRVGNMESTPFCKDIKGLLESLIYNKKLSLDDQLKLFSKFEKKLIYELDLKIIAQKDIYEIQHLLNAIRNKVISLSYQSFNDELIKCLKFASILFVTCLAANIIDDEQLCIRLIILALLDYSLSESIIEPKDIKYNFQNLKLKEIYSFLAISQEIHLIEYPGLKFKQDKFSKTISESREMLKGLLEIQTKKKFKHKKRLNEQFCEIFVTLCRRREVLLLVLFERYSLLWLLDFFPEDYFSKIDRTHICNETKLVHAVIADRTGFGWIKWRLEDNAFKHLDPVNFYRIKRVLKCSRKIREKFVTEIINQLEDVFLEINIDEIKDTKSKLQETKKLLDSLYNTSFEYQLVDNYINNLIKNIEEISESLIIDKKEKVILNSRNSHPWFKITSFSNIRTLRNLKRKKKLPEELIFILRLIKKILLSSSFLEIIDIYGRPKSIYSIYKKEIERNISVEQHQDLVGVRIIVETSHIFNMILLQKENRVFNGKDFIFFPFPHYCYRASELVQLIYGDPAKLKDFIEFPKCNGYMAIHLVFKTKDPTFPFIEIQIRDRNMDELAEYGVAAHWIYEREGKKSKELKEQKNVWSNLQKKLTKGDSFDKIFVLTPKFEVKQLSKGSTPLDFAYKVHTEVGHHCARAIVNDKMVSFKTKLYDGDRVEILKSPKVTAKFGWLELVNSSRLRNRIKNYLFRMDDELTKT